ncbi:MAG: hydroxymethylpyrimidine/phosphomethylpyrimidine kinase [Gammaproteobacteria bacterium]|nr:hydroxymethylpyrimidine/phosphomethylpyrimidine kinase [Gammaproteobacteria bacterium]
MTFIKPTVLCFSGLDPTGGAGLQADIETLVSIGCHCSPVATALTAQNTHNAISMQTIDTAFLMLQAHAIMDDITVQCFKVGLLGNVEIVEVLQKILQDYPDIPVVLDPIACAGGGFKFGGDEVLEAIRSLLIPLTTVLTPNTDEIRKLAPSSDSLEAGAYELLEQGCEHVLLTGTHAKNGQVKNKWFSSSQDVTIFNWERLQEVYHGSGCTLSAAIAGYLAHKLDMHAAIQQAQRFTWEALKNGFRIGYGQHIPNRSYRNKQTS